MPIAILAKIAAKKALQIATTTAIEEIVRISAENFSLPKDKKSANHVQRRRKQRRKK